jgi:hypothetical protein
MTSGLVMGRKTTFIDGYYVLVSEMTLPYVAEDVKTIEIIARGKIEELENEM